MSSLFFVKCLGSRADDSRNLLPPTALDPMFKYIYSKSHYREESNVKSIKNTDRCNYSALLTSF